jgi:hypothetical protein
LATLPKDGTGLALEREGQDGILGHGKWGTLSSRGHAPTARIGGACPLASPPKAKGGKGGRGEGGKEGGDLEEGKVGDLESRMEGLWGEDLGSERGLQWMHKLGPCTTPSSLGYPPKLLLKLNDFSIFFGDFSFFW